jgi:glycosyltransferase
MKISLITVSHNSASTIRDTFDSILNQTYPHIEYMVVDGASIDNTLDIIKEYELKFNGRMKWISEPDTGIYHAMNKGIEKATGDVIGILNSDDIYFDDKVIEDIMHCFASQKCDAVYGDLIYVDTKNTTKIKRYWKSGHYKPRSFKFGWMPPHPSFFVKKEIYNTYGLFRTDFKSASDYEFMLRVICKAHITLAYIPKVFVVMRTGGTSNASLGNHYKGNKEDRRAWKVNQLSPYFFTFILKPIRKIPQFFVKI